MNRDKARPWIAGGSLGAAVVLGALLLVMLNYLAGRYYHRSDWTSVRLYSLSETTEQLLRELDEPVELISFLPPAGDGLAEAVKELLERYEAASPEITTRFIDPLRSPLEAETLVQRFQLDQDSVVVVATTTDRRIVDAQELVEWDYSGASQGLPPKISGFYGESAVSNAILQLVEGDKPQVVFVRGHGEGSPEDTSAEGFSELARRLSAQHFKISDWVSLNTPEVPAGTDLVVLAGPRIPLQPAELEALGRYLDGGGRLLALVDLSLSDNLPPRAVELGLAPWLSGYGVELGVDLVTDPQRPVVFLGSETFSVDSFGDHPVTSGLMDGRVAAVLSLARSAGAAAGDGAGMYRVTELLRTTPAGWAERDLGSLPELEKGDDDLSGPVPLGVAVEPREEPEGDLEPFPDEEETAAEEVGEAGAGPRLVVFGDATFASNALLLQASNETLIRNAVNWLVERETQLGIPPKEPEHVRLNLDAGQVRNLRFLSLLGLPGLAALIGVLIWFRRRR